MFHTGFNINSMTSRPAVSVYDPATLNTTDKKIGLPAVFTAPIRLDIV
jgi:hypothetical protein